MEEFWQYKDLIFLKGGALNIKICIGSLVLATLFGFLGAWAKLSKSRIATSAAEGYTTIVRGIPDLVLLLIIYYSGQVLLNDLGEAIGAWDKIDISPLMAGIGTIAFIMGAYYTETFRGAYLSIHRGQIEAAIAVGMSNSLILRRIIWPNIVRYGIPSFTNNWLVQIKMTALVSLIGLQDVVHNASAIGRKMHQPFIFLFAAMLFFLFLTTISQIALRALERKYTTSKQPT